MPRKPRVDVKGFYHVINRGVEKRTVFIDEADFEAFMRILDKSALVYGFKLHAYALMANHYHLLIETFAGNLSLIMRQINSKYSIYFNKKYDRVGPLWQGRFKSFYIYDNTYLNIVIKYIENNPIKAGIADEPGFYSYASKNIMFSNNAQWDESDDQQWSKWINSKFDIDKHQNITEKRSQPLSMYFKENKISDSQIMHAWLDGYKQASIAGYLKLSTALISRRIGRYYKKQELFFAAKQKGLFWSYDKKLEYSEALDNLLIETVLKYGDFIDLKQLFILYGKRAVKKIWKEKMIDDTRFIKLNCFLARIFFGMDVEADFFKGGMGDREKKLRMLAS